MYSIIFRSRFLLFVLVLIACLISIQRGAQAIPLDTQATDVWEEEIYNSGAPTERHEASIVNVDGLFYLMGSRETSAVEVYNPLTKSWTHNGDAPINFHHFQPVLVDGLVYVIGALIGNFPNETPVADIYIYDPAANEWDTAASQIPANRQRGSAGAVAYNGKIYIVGGNTLGHEAGYVPWFDEYDPATGSWTPLTDAPTARDHFTAVVIGDQLIIAGGRQTDFDENDSLNTFRNTVPTIDIYDFTTGQWNTLPAASNLPTPRAGVMNVHFGQEVIVIGGETTQGSAHDEVEALDIDTGQWRTLDNLINGRHSGGAVVEGNCIYVVAGSESRAATADTVLNTMEKYTFSTPSPDLTLEISGVTVSEAAGTAAAEVTLSAAGCRPEVTVDYATSSGTATAGDDYTPSSGTLTFSSSTITSTTTHTITFPIIEDTLDEHDETVNITLSNPVSATIGSGTATVIITDNDSSPTLTIDDPVVDETAAAASFTLTLDNPSGKQISAQYATINGSATAGDDYTASSGTATIPAGASSATIEVPLIDDAIGEENETFTLTLSNVTNATADKSSATATIIDDETVNLYFSQTDFTADETAANGQLTAMLSRTSSDSVTVDYAITGGSASAGEDYQPISGTLTLTAGVTETMITLPLQDDNIYETDETVQLTLSNPQSAVPVNLVTGGETATLTIVDNEAVPTIHFDNDTYGLLEGGDLQFDVYLSHPSSTPLPLTLITTNGTATAPADYTPLNENRTFAALQTTLSFSLSTTDDDLIETAETFTMTASSTAGETSATTTITDNDGTLIYLPLLAANPTTRSIP